MLTRFVRIQLAIFTIASILGCSVVIFKYLQAPTLLGIGHLTVTMELPRGGGLYNLANVTYRGAEVGKVTSVDLTSAAAVAVLSIDDSIPIPADLSASVRSVSAIGEQFVELRPHSDSPPYLRDGSVIDIDDVTVPQPVGPMLDEVSALLASIPRDQLGVVLDESATAFDDAGYDLGSLLDSLGTVARRGSEVAPEFQGIIEDASPLLDGQVQSAEDTRVWARSLAGVTDTVAANDAHVRTALETAPAALQEVSHLLDSVKPTLPVLLANLTSIGQIAVTYMPSLEQLLVLLPPFVADLQGIAPYNNATGLPLGNFRIQSSDPPACTVGFLPPSQWRSPADTTTVDTPDGLYCKLPQDSPILVRGARNLPCLAHPGKRAPTVEICDSDQPYMPLAMRQHALGPSPFDPNLVSQGVPLDDRVTTDERIFGPIEGTPLPEDAPPTAPPPAPGLGPPAPPLPVPSAGDTAAPAAYEAAPAGAPLAVATATYDPRTGQFVAPDGMTYEQSSIVDQHARRDWKDFVLPSQLVS